MKSEEEGTNTVKSSGQSSSNFDSNTHTFEESSHSSTHSNPHTGSRMAANTLSNLRACVKEFNTEESSDPQCIAKRFESWLENFEACADFEEVPDNKRKPALQTVGGEKLRELLKTLGVVATDDYKTAKDKLVAYYTPKKNTSAERFKFLNMRPESTEESHDHWVTRLRRKVKDCEFNNFNDDEAIKLVIMLFTHNTTLQRQIIAKDMDLTRTMEQARALELTDRELSKIKETGPQLGANKVSVPPRSSRRFQGKRRDSNNTKCIYCGGPYPHTKEAPCKARSV